VLFFRVCHREIKATRGELKFFAGPYTFDTEHYGEDIVEELSEMASRHARLPNTPSVLIDFDYMLPFWGNFVCGFTSPEKLKRWFEGYAELLFVADFLVRVWEIPPVFLEYGTYQDVARIDWVAKGEPILEMDFAEFENRYGRVDL